MSRRACRVDDERSCDQTATGITRRSATCRGTYGRSCGSHGGFDASHFRQHHAGSRRSTFPSSSRQSNIGGTDYLVTYQCGFILRLYETPPAEWGTLRVRLGDVLRSTDWFAGQVPDLSNKGVFDWASLH